MMATSSKMTKSNRFRFDITTTVQEHHALLYFFLLLLHDYDTKVKHCDLSVAAPGVASHANIFKGACFSSLPTNTCSTENNIPFPLFYLHGRWLIISFEINCWQAKLKRDPKVTVFLLLFPSLSLCSAWSILKFDQILLLPLWI